MSFTFCIFKIYGWIFAHMTPGREPHKKTLDQLNMYSQKQIKNMMELRSLYIVSYDW